MAGIASYELVYKTNEKVKNFKCHGQFSDWKENADLQIKDIRNIQGNCWENEKV